MSRSIARSLELANVRHRLALELLLVPEDASLSVLLLEPGSHWLPRPPFDLASSTDGTEEVRYSRGFLVPVGSRSLAVLVAVRPSVFGKAERDEWKRELREVAEPQATAVARWKTLLERKGFTMRELTVREP